MLNKEKFQKAKKIFDSVVDLPSEQQQAKIKTACGDDLELRNHLLEMLKADQSTDSFIDQPAISHLESLMAENLSNTTIGRYKLKRKLAAGGMGTVYLAERDDGQFKQRVALKLVKKGMDSEEILVRFEAERQMLAGLDHPNIARLIDGGRADSGQPYFCMEYVDGLPITEYCQNQKLNLNETLDLFGQVCDAVQFAHQNLIVHRDLKPTNILVDKEGRIKLLDFGIAKMLGEAEPGEENRNLTRTGLRILTPAYASPEQILNRPITTASDVYSLGVLLYQLLTGTRPFSLDQMSPVEVEKFLETASPSKPSEITKKQSKDVAQLHVQNSSQLKGDVDNICLKALHREPTRRYSSASQLKEDIIRFQNKQPVIARPDTSAYRFSRFVSRHKSSVVAGLTMLTIVVMVAWYYTEQLSDERDFARLEAAKATQVSEFLSGLFSAADPNESGGKEITVRELLDIGSETIEEDLAGQPEVRAMMTNVMGNVYLQIGQLEIARDMIIRSLTEFRSIHGELHSDVARSYRDLGSIYYYLDEFDSSETAYRNALGIDRKISPDADSIIASDLTNLGSTLRVIGNLDEAENLFREALLVHRERNSKGNLDLAHTLNQLGRLLFYQERLDEAEGYFREGLEIREEVFGGDNYEVCASRGALAALLRKNNDLEGARVLIQANLDSFNRLVGNDHHFAGATMNSLAHIVREQGDYEYADSLYEGSIEILRRTLNEGNMGVAFPLIGIAMLRMEQERPADALSFINEAVQVRTDGFPKGHWQVGIALTQRGRCYILLEKFIEAKSDILTARRFFVETYSSEHSYVQTADSLLACIPKTEN